MTEGLLAAQCSRCLRGAVRLSARLTPYCFKTRTKSCGFPVIVIEQSADSLSTSDLSGWGELLRINQLIIQALVISLLMTTRVSGQSGKGVDDVIPLPRARCFELHGTASTLSTMKTQLPLTALGFVLNAVCVAAGNALAGAASYDYGATVSAVVALQGKVNRFPPEHFSKPPAKRTGAEWNPDAYFTVLRHISLPEGYLLDYVYIYTRLGGRPQLYLRKWAEPRFELYADYEKSFQDPAHQREAEEKLSSRLQLDGSLQGFFELIVFHCLKDHFYLRWHDYYRETKILTSRSDLEEIVSSLEKTSLDERFTAEQKEQSLRIDATPHVRFLDDDTAEVAVVTFSEWGGFSRLRWHVARDYPHTITRTGFERLVEYDCGMSF